MNELKKKILKSDFYKSIYENQKTRTIDLSVPSIEAGMEEASAILECPLHEITYDILEYGSGGVFGIGVKPYYVRYKHTVCEKENIAKKDSYSADKEVERVGRAHIILDKDSEIIVRVKRDGVFLKVNPPVGQGKKLSDILLVEKALAASGITTYNASLAKEVFEKQDGKYVMVADWSSSKSVNNGKITYNISDDKMRVFITITKPSIGGREMDMNDVLTFLENNSIVYGVQEETISKALENQTYGVPIIAAEGTLPTNGQNAKIDYLVNVGHKSIPKFIGEDESIDYRDLSIVENVIAGQILATKIDATFGESGRTVFGIKIDTKDGNDIDMRDYVGENTELSEDEKSIIAKINGQVVLKSKQLNVEPVFEVKGDVGPETGNINFLGSVLVKGNVLDNYSIEANGNIDIQGTVGKSILKSNGNIMVKLGIQGKEEGLVHAEGDVIAKFIQFSNVYAGRDVIATESIFNSNIDAGNRIILIGKKASASGGRLRAYYEVNGKILGSVSSLRTLIETGVKPARRKMLDGLTMEKEELEKTIEELTRSIQAFEQLERTKKLDDEKKQKLDEQREQKKQSEERIESILEEKENIMQIIESEKVSSTISAGKEALSGVIITIGSAEFVLRQSYKSVTFFEEEGLIQTGKYRGAAKQNKTEVVKPDTVDVQKTEYKSNI